MSLLLSLMVSKQISFSVPAGSLQTTQNQNNTFLAGCLHYDEVHPNQLTTDSSEAQYVRGSQAGHELTSQVSAYLYNSPFSRIFLDLDLRQTRRLNLNNSQGCCLCPQT